MNRIIFQPSAPERSTSGRVHSISIDRAQISQRSVKRPRILIVDDQVDLAQTCAEFLSLEGYPVATAFDGKSGLEMALREKPDVAILDIGLPGLDGYELGRRLRQHFGPRIRLVALTAWGMDEHRERTRAAGFDHHLLKPADLDQLHDILNDAAAG